MDVSGLVLTSLGIAFEVASTLYAYGRSVKGARRDIQNLSNELFGLIGALEHLKIQQEHRALHKADTLEPPSYAESEAGDVKDGDTDENGSLQDRRQENDARVLKQTLEFLQELQKSLDPPTGRFRTAIQLMKWPLREGEVQNHLTRLERVKTYFVLSLVTGEVDQSQKTASEISMLRTMLEDVSLRQLAAHSRTEHQGMVEWLCPVDPNITRCNIEKTRIPGTGNWFSGGEELRSQITANESSCLWLNGITGAGKTTLMTAATDELLERRNPHHNVAYFYCSFSNAESLETHSILGSILAQICVNTDPVYHELMSKYMELSSKSVSKGVKLDDDVLVELFTKQAKLREHLHIVIDGVNECSDPGELLKAFTKILNSVKGVQLLISSINEKKIRQSLSHMPKLYEVTASPRLIRSDIFLLVHSALKTQPRLEELPQSMKDEIATRLTHGAEGMFRWVQCQLDLLSKLRTPGAVKMALDSLPLTLDKTYEDLLDRVDGEEDRSLTRQILQILAFTFRPLALDEVSTMLQVMPGMRRLDESKCLTHPTDILDICGGLLKYNERTRTVTLAHHSVKTYLTQHNASYFRLDREEAHRTLASICISCLSFDAFTHEVKDIDLEIENCPALDYATEYWPLHLKNLSDSGESLWGDLSYFLLSADHNRCNFINWVRILTSDSPLATKTPPLYYAASYGLTSVVKHLLEMGVNTEIHGGRGGATPINIAAFRGHLDVVKLLYENGADPLKRDRATNLNAIQWANFEKRPLVTEYFKSKGFTP